MNEYEKELFAKFKRMYNASGYDLIEDESGEFKFRKLEIPKGEGVKGKSKEQIKRELEDLEKKDSVTHSRRLLDTLNQA